MSRLSTALLLALAACRAAPVSRDRPGIASRKVSAGIMCAALSPDGREVALGLESGCVLRVRLSDMTVTVHQPGHADWVVSISYLDNDTVLSGAIDGLCRWRRQGDGSIRMDRIKTIKGEVLRAGLGSCTSAVARVAVSPRGTAAAYITFAGDLVVLDATLTTTLAWRRFPIDRPMGLEFLDETRIAVTGWADEGAVHIWDYPCDAAPRVIPVPGASSTLAVLAQGPELIVDNGGRGLVFVRGSALRFVHLGEAIPGSIATDSGGRRVAVSLSSSAHGPDDAIVIDPSGRRLYYSTKLPGTLRVVLLTPDGSTLIAGGDGRVLWRLPLPAWE
jgi:WD40 repeat protein